MPDEIEVKQSSESASTFTLSILDRDVRLIFLSSTKGRMDFTIEINGTPNGKVNLLSQHSIQRIGASLGLTDDEKITWKTQLLKVGQILREGTFTPAPEAEVEDEIDQFTGEDSTLGSIDEKTIMKFLGDDLLLDRINAILHESRNTPFVGDDANLILTFLVMISCKTDSPLNLEMVATSAAGKTYMVLTARNGLPKSMCMVLAGASREALKYDYDEVDEDGNYIVNVDGKCIIILEKDESFSFVRKMKPLMSGDDKELVWKTPIKNDMTGDIETRDFIIRGQPSFITLTTRNPSEQEQVTRQLLMTPDTTVEKIGMVVENTLLAKARPERFQVHPDLKMLQASMLSLGNYRIRNIFAPLMADFFPSRNAQHQRDIGKVLSIIDAITLMHQKRRPVEVVDGEEFLLSSIEDNLIGLVLADLVLRASLSGVPDDSWGVFVELGKMEEAKRPLTEDNILQWLHIHAFTLSKNALVSKHLPTLEDSGLVEVARRGGGRGGARKTYRIVKTRKGLMESYALSPLFVESVRDKLPSIISDYQDVLSRCTKPKKNRKLDHGENIILKSLGCKTKHDSLIWRSLFLPSYFRKANRKNTLLANIIGSSPQGDLLFTGTAWLDRKIEQEATKKLEVRKEVREKVKKATMDESTMLEDDEIWDSLAEEHFGGWNES